MIALIANSQVVVQQRMGLYEGPIAIEHQSLEDPVLKWHGSKMSAYTWRAIAAFMRWTLEEFNSEAQLRLYYNQFTDKWKPVVFPQWVSTGMVSDEIANHADRDAIFAGVAECEGWCPAGTIHHHCRAGAFQSGTDEKDELAQNGLHLTLGNLHLDILDIHSRATFRKVGYLVDLDEWIEPTGDALFKAEGKFPKSWRKHCHVKPKAAPIHTSRTYTTRTWQEIMDDRFCNEGYTCTAGEDYSWDGTRDSRVTGFKASDVGEVDAASMALVESVMEAPPTKEMFLTAREMVKTLESINDAAMCLQEAVDALGISCVYTMVEMVEWFNIHFDDRDMLPHNLYSIEDAAAAYDAVEDAAQLTKEETHGGTVPKATDSGDTARTVDSPAQLVAGCERHGNGEDVHGVGSGSYTGPVPPRYLPQGS
tara:strand:+ start:1102 stop:2367 length:1266 start_codon:yes stop_codon:yes gene_type:complete